MGKAWGFSLLDPCSTGNRVDVSVFVLVPVCIHLVILAEEGALIEGVFVWHVACL